MQQGKLMQVSRAPPAQGQATTAAARPKLHTLVDRCVVLCSARVTADCYQPTDNCQSLLRSCCH